MSYEGCYTPLQECGELAQEIGNLKLEKNLVECCCVLFLYIQLGFPSIQRGTYHSDTWREL